jgi:hypothetical protein
MAQSIFLFKRKTQNMGADRFNRLAEKMALKGELVSTDEALFLRDDTRALAYAQPCAKFAGLLLFADQSIAWGEATERLVSGERARDWARELIEEFELLPKPSDQEHIKLEFALEGLQTEAVVFDGKERRRMKAKTDVLSKISLNGVPVVGPRGKVRMIFKSDDRPVMMHTSLWESLAIYEERELVREHDAVRMAHDRLTQRGDSREKPYDVRDVRLVYFADEYRGGPDVLAPEYLVEVEFRDPRYAGKQAIQGPRQVIRLDASR